MRYNMKRLIVFVLIFCFIGTMGYGCIKSSKPIQLNENEVILDHKEDSSPSISKEELQNGLIEKLIIQIKMTIWKVTKSDQRCCMNML